MTGPVPAWPADTGPGATQVAAALVELVERFGRGLLEDPRRTRAMLADLLPEAGAPISLIGLALDVQAGDRLARAGRSAPELSAAADAVVLELQAGHAVQPPAAQWAVAAVGQAIGRPVPAADTPPPPRPAAAPAPPDALVVTLADRVQWFAAGTVVGIGRDPANEVVLSAPSVSRRHAQVSWRAGQWWFVDLGSTQGSFHRGAAIGQLAVVGELDIVLAQGPAAVPLRLRGPSPVVLPPPVPAPGWPAPLAPVAPVPADPRPILVVSGTQQRSLAPGQVLHIGRDATNDLVLSALSVSRRHARIGYEDGAWVLTDLGSAAGTWLGGAPAQRVVLAGEQTFLLGDPDAGTPVRVSVPPPLSRRGRRRRWFGSAGG